MDDEVFVEGIARWYAGGVTSGSHPVLRWALERYFLAEGIPAGEIEAEPFGDLELEQGIQVWIRGADAPVSARVRTRIFLAAAAGALLFDRELAAIYAAGDDLRFAAEIAGRLEAAKPTAEDHTAVPPGA